MVDIMLLIPIVTSFVVAVLFLPLWIKKARGIGLVWEDMNKPYQVRVAGSGGIVVVLGFIIGVLLYVAYEVFYLNSSIFLIEILALLSLVMFVSGIGLIDDILGWRKGGLSKTSRLILLAFSAIPLMAIKAGDSIVAVPYFGIINFSYLYPLVIIPIGIIGATSTYNFLAGYNGLEAAQGILILLAMSLVSYLTGSAWLSVVSLCMIFSLMAFLIFNFYPAKVFPGDSMTYAVGSLIASVSILGNFERIAVFFFIPYILETILKSRGRLKMYSFGKPNKDGTLNLRYDKLYGLEHVAIYLLNKTGIRATEKKVVFSILTFQFFIIILGLILFRDGIFK